MKALSLRIDKSELLRRLPSITERIKLERQKIIETRKAIPDLKSFANTYFKHYIESPFGIIQDHLIEAVERLTDRKNRSYPIRQSIAAPRGFAKSSIVTLMGVLWLVLRKDHHFVVILSSSKTTAMGFLQSIIDEIEQNDLLIETFPELLPAIDFKSQTVAWRDSEIVFKNGVRIMALGWLNSVRGLRKKSARPDLIIADDPDEDKDVNSENRMNRKYKWFDRAILNLGGKKPVDVFVCYTTINEICVGEHIFTNYLKYADWIRHKYRAIEIDETGQEISTWQDAYPIERLKQMREEDPLGFATERQNEPLPEIDQPFKGQITTYNYTGTIPTGTKTLAIDLSLGKTEDSDYSAIIGTVCSVEGKYLEIYSSIERRPPIKIMNDIIYALQVIKYDIVGIETTGNQEHFLESFKVFLADWNGKNQTSKIVCPVIGISNTGDKIKRIKSVLQVLVSSKWLLLRQDSELLIKQLNNFPHDKKDGPDALEMSVSLHTVVSGSKIVVPRIGVATTMTAEGIHSQRLNRLNRLNRGF